MRVLLMQINPRTSLAWCLKAVLIVGCWIISFYGTFFGFQSFMVRLLLYSRAENLTPPWLCMGQCNQICACSGGD